jgi:hypothetical protein
MPGPEEDVSADREGSRVQRPAEAVSLVVVMNPDVADIPAKCSAQLSGRPVVEGPPAASGSFDRALQRCVDRARGGVRPPTAGGCFSMAPPYPLTVPG